MYNACMATKTISLRLDAYERLRAARRSEDESFTQVILRATWPESTLTALELMERDPVLTMEELDRIDELKREQSPPQDKWKS